MCVICIKEKGVEISSLAFYPNTMDGDLEQRAKNIEHLKKVILASERLGVNMVTTFIGRETGKNIDEITAKFTGELAKIWRVHPFRDGNTRTTLAFAENYSREHGFPMDIGILLDHLTRLVTPKGDIVRYSIRDKFVLAALDEKDYPEPEAIVTALRNGARVEEIPVIMQERLGGKSSINFLRSIYYMVKVSMAIFIAVLHKKKVI